MTIVTDLDDVKDTIIRDLPFVMYTNHWLGNILTTEIYSWMREHFGPEMFEPIEDEHALKHNENAVWDYFGTKPAVFYFRDVNDALLFKLTWGNE